MSVLHALGHAFAAHATHQVASKGGNVLGRGLDAVRPTALPGLGELFELFYAGKITITQLAGALRVSNVYLPNPNLRPVAMPKKEADSYAALWEAMLDLSEPKPTEDILLVAKNRGIITEDKLREVLAEKGWAKGTYIDLWSQLANEIPGSADLVRFAVRHVFEPDLVTAFGYNDELNPEFIKWHAKQGFGYEIPWIDINGVQHGTFYWAQAFWWSHWVQPSPTQGYEMLHRLRPTGGPDGGPRDPSGQVFDAKSLALLLRANDYPPYYREKLAAISFRPIGIRMLRGLLDVGLAKRQDLIELFQDQGYHLSTSTLQADLLIAQKTAKDTKDPAKAAKTWALKAYRLGLIDHSEAIINVHRSLLPTLDKLNAFDALSAEQQLGEASADRQASVDVDVALLDRTLQEAQQVITSTRRQFIRGILTEAAARQRMGTAGIRSDAMDSYLATWKLELDLPRKEMSTSVILKLLRYRLISTDEGIRRLQNLGWDNADIPALLLDTAREQGLDAAKAAAALARTEAQRIAAQKAAIREARTARLQAMSDLARHGNPAQLKRWLTQGLIDAGLYGQRMAALGWPDEDIARVIGEVQQTLADKAAKAGQTLGTLPKLPVKRPSTPTLQKWLKRGIIDPATFAARAADNGVEARDIANYITEATGGK